VGSLQRSPDHLAGLRGPTSKGGEEKGKERGEEKGRGRMVRGEHPLCQFLSTCLLKTAEIEKRDNEQQIDKYVCLFIKHITKAYASETTTDIR